MRKQVLKLMMAALLMVFMVPCVNAQVFVVDDSSEHGWVVALEDDGLLPWGGCGEDTDLENYTRRGSAPRDIDGYANTKAILETGKDYPAFLAVDFENGWYLPAIGQLKHLYKNLDEVNETIVKIGWSTVKPIGLNYWSSTEYSDIDAWYLTTIGGIEYTSDGYNDNKNGYRFVRSVRDF